MQYRSLAGGDVFVQEDADADVSQLLGTLHVANGTGFHSVLELSAGATMYSRFAARSDGRKLNNESNDLDFSFSFGYGFGYAFSPTFSVDIVQDLATALHQKTGSARVMSRAFVCTAPVSLGGSVSASTRKAGPSLRSGRQ